MEPSGEAAGSHAHRAGRGWRATPTGRGQGCPGTLQRRPQGGDHVLVLGLEEAEKGPKTLHLSAGWLAKAESCGNRHPKLWNPCPHGLLPEVCRLPAAGDHVSPLGPEGDARQDITRCGQSDKDLGSGWRSRFTHRLATEGGSSTQPEPSWAPQAPSPWKGRTPSRAEDTAQGLLFPKGVISLPPD